MGNDFLKKFADADINGESSPITPWPASLNHSKPTAPRAVVAAARLFIDSSCVPDANISKATVGSIRVRAKHFVERINVCDAGVMQNLPTLTKLTSLPVRAGSDSTTYVIAP
jgi:hypothetical protein